MDKFKSCKDCPDRALGCRRCCAGWMYREMQKEKKYAENLKRVDSYYRPQMIIKACKEGQI